MRLYINLLIINIIIIRLSVKLLLMEGFWLRFDYCDLMLVFLNFLINWVFIVMVILEERYVVVFVFKFIVL